MDKKVWRAKYEFGEILGAYLEILNVGRASV
jgi:hypothetical protein